MHSYDYQNLVVNGSMPAAGENSSAQWTWNGINDLVYTDSQAASETKICAEPTTGAVIAKSSMTIDGITIDLPPSNINLSGQGQLPYTCDANNYRYTVDTGVFQHTWIYNRIGVLTP